MTLKGARKGRLDRPAAALQCTGASRKADGGERSESTAAYGLELRAAKCIVRDWHPARRPACFGLRGAGGLAGRTRPGLQRCLACGPGSARAARWAGPKAPRQCKTLGAQTFEMETAAFAHVAHANRIPHVAFRSPSDLAGATEFNADVGALFSSGLADANEACGHAGLHRGVVAARRQAGARDSMRASCAAAAGAST